MNNINSYLFDKRNGNTWAVFFLFGLLDTYLNPNYLGADGNEMYNVFCDAIQTIFKDKMNNTIEKPYDKIYDILKMKY